MQSNTFAGRLCTSSLSALATCVETQSHRYGCSQLLWQPQLRLEHVIKNKQPSIKQGSFPFWQVKLTRSPTKKFFWSHGTLFESHDPDHSIETRRETFMPCQWGLSMLAAHHTCKTNNKEEASTCQAPHGCLASTRHRGMQCRKLHLRESKHTYAPECMRQPSEGSNCQPQAGLLSGSMQAGSS